MSASKTKRPAVPLIDPLTEARIVAMEVGAASVAENVQRPRTTDAELAEEVHTDILTALQQGKI